MNKEILTITLLVKNPLILNILHWLKKLRQILNYLNLKLAIESHSNINLLLSTFLVNSTVPGKKNV